MNRVNRTKLRDASRRRLPAGNGEWLICVISSMKLTFKYNIQFASGSRQEAFAVFSVSFFFFTSDNNKITCPGHKSKHQNDKSSA